MQTGLQPLKSNPPFPQARNKSFYLGKGNGNIIEYGFI